MATTSLDDRVAALEAKAKPKGWVDRFKEWAGVVSIIVAGAYTFPLGLWDRYIETPKSEEARKTEEIRDAAIRLTDIDADLAKTYLSITDNAVRSMYGRALASKKAALLQRNQENIDRYYKTLTPPEILLLAYNFMQAGDFGRASAMLSGAREKLSAQKSPIQEADAARMQAQVALNRGDFETARRNFADGLGILLAAPSMGGGLPASYAAADWGSVELGVGDWQCGQTLLKWAIAATAALPSNPDVLTYRAQYQAALAISPAPKPGQPTVGCPASLLNWTKFGAP